MSIFNSELSYGEISSALKDVKNSVYFVGILGSGMYPLAKILRKRGYRVEGFDRAALSDEYFDDLGIIIARHELVPKEKPSLMVYSLAVYEECPLIRYAKEQGIPLISRAQLLGFMMSGSQTRISVSGSHGKSTITALIDHILASSGVPHTTVSGATLNGGESYRDTGDEVFLAEACEYKDSFLRLCPTHQIISSVELDHTDYFEDLDAITSSFFSAAKGADTVVVNADDRGAADIIARLRRLGKSNVITYSRVADSDYRICSVVTKSDRTHLTVLHKTGKIHLNTTLIGGFNLYNITAAVAITHTLGIASEEIASAISSFTSIDRRMSRITYIDGTPVFYDYAHHPSEIEAVIDAIKERYGTLALIFRPHTYSRTKALWQDFILALKKADRVILLDIYAAREDKIDGVDSSYLAECIPGACYVFDQLQAARLVAETGCGAIALIGAGNVETAKNELMKLGKIKNKDPKGE